MRAAAPVLPLPVAMVQSPFRTPLVSAVGDAPLTQSCLVAASQAAVALSAVTVRTEKERRKTVPELANPLPENRFPMRRHASPQAALDNGSRFVAP